MKRYLSLSKIPASEFRQTASKRSGSVSTRPTSQGARIRRAPDLVWRSSKRSSRHTTNISMSSVRKVSERNLSSPCRSHKKKCSTICYCTSFNSPHEVHEHPDLIHFRCGRMPHSSYSTGSFLCQTSCRLSGNHPQTPYIRTGILPSS